jgi:WD40 repeat protein
MSETFSKSNTKNVAKLYQLSSESICSCFLSGVPNLLAVGLVNSRILFWDVSSSKEINHYRLNGDQPISLCDVPGRNLLAIGTQTGEIHLFDYMSFTCFKKRKVPLHNPLRNIMQLGMDALAITPAFGRAVYLWKWDWEASYVLHHDFEVHCVCSVGKWSRLLASGDDEGKIHIHCGYTRRTLKSVQALSNLVVTVCSLEDGHIIAAGSRFAVALIDWRKGMKRRNVEVTRNYVLQVIKAFDEFSFVTGTGLCHFDKLVDVWPKREGRVLIISSKNGEWLQNLKYDQLEVGSVAINQRANMLAVLLKGELRIWNL